MLNKIFLVTLFLVSSAASAADKDPYSSAMEELKNNSAAIVSIQSGWTVIQIEGDIEQSIWSFTPEAHPAHPAFAKRTIFQDENGAWSVKTNLSCGAIKTECEKLLKEFEALDERMKNEIARDKKT